MRPTADCTLRRRVCCTGSRRNENANTTNEQENRRSGENMIGRSGLVAAYVVAAIAIGGAQQVPPDTGTTFRSGVDVVRLDVSVLDQNRLPIRGLTAANFTVLEDGRPQPIIAFDAVDLPDHWSARASWMRDVAPDVVSNRFNAQRVVVILLDDFGVPFDPSAVQFSKNIARAAIDQLGPAD